MGTTKGKKEVRRFTCFSDLQVWYFSDAFQQIKVNSSVAHDIHNNMHVEVEW